MLERVCEALDLGFSMDVQADVDTLLADPRPAARAQGARALRQLGAGRRADALLLRWSRGPVDDPTMHLACARTMIGWRAHLGLAWMRRHAFPSDASPELQAEYIGCEAAVAALLRDFPTARDRIGRALAMSPGTPWLHVEHAYVLERDDRNAEALEAVERALALVPGYRTAIQSRVRLLLMLGRRDEALALCERESAARRCAPLAVQLFSLQMDERRHAQAEASLERAAALSPLADRDQQRWFRARRCDVAMALGRLDEAREHADALPADHHFYKRVSRRLRESPPDGPRADRRVLDVPFIAQHWATCAPATLASIARYWGVAAEHVEIAEQICYDGTPAHSQVAWARSQGLHVREFRLDEASAHALIDAGVPYALVTVQPGSSHLQAVIGYDRLRCSLLIRDPNQPVQDEFSLQPLLESHRASGPRAMVLLPEDERHRLDGIDLPDAALWDLYGEAQACLARHDRDGAQRALDRLVAEDGERRLATQVRYSLARYDGDDAAALSIADDLLALDPDDVNLQLSRSAWLWSAGHRDVHLAWFERVAGGAGAHPMLLAQWAERLAEDHRQLDVALALARRAWRRAPLDGRAWGTMAMLLWQADRRDEALPLYRITSCLQPASEPAATAYHRACVLRGRTEEGLAFLRERVERLGARSGAPAMTLFERLDALERLQEGFAVLEEAVERRPDDADLRLFVADACIRYADVAACERHLDAVTQPARAASVLLLRARLAQRRHDDEAAWRLAEEGCALDPFDIPLRRLVAQSIAVREGSAASIAWLRQACDAHPRQRRLQQLLYDWLPDEPAVREDWLARMSELHPDDAWLLRERAIQAGRQGRLDAAVELAAMALQRSPDDDRSHSTMGYALLRRDGYAAAAPHLWRALERNPDNEFAMERLVEAVPDPGEAPAVLRRVLELLRAAPRLGEGIVEFQRLAGPVLEDAEVHAALHAFWTERPETWETWLALATHCQRAGREAEALALLEQAVERFPLLPRMHLNLSRMLQAAGERERARAALAPALLLSPGWNPAVRQHVDLVDPQDRAAEEEQRVLRRALVHAPGDADLRGVLAWVLERAGDLDGAVNEARESLLADPSAQWVWAIVRRIALSRETPALFDGLVDQVEARRPGDPMSWLVRARHGSDAATALSAAQEALRLDPRLTAAWIARMERLQQLGRHDEVHELLAHLPWPDAAPAAVLVFGPRSLWQQGRRDEAVAALSELLRGRPHEFDLWQQLADWQDARDQHDEYLRAAREMLRLAPTSALAPAYLGHAMLKAGDAEGAIAPLQLACHRETDYAFARRQLALAAREAKRHDLVEDLCERAWASQKDAVTARDGVLAGCGAGAPERAARWWRRLIEVAGAATGPVDEAAKAMADAGWGDALDRSVRAALLDGHCATHAGFLYLRRMERARGAGRVWLELWQLHRRHASVPLAGATMKWLTGRGHGRALRAYVWRHDALLRADLTAWGEVSYHLLQFPRQQRAVVRWLRDWRERAGAPAWALGNLSLSLAALDRWTEAADVARHVVSRKPDNEDARLWLLAGDAVRGDLAAVQHGLARLHEWKPDAWMACALSLIKSWEASLREGSLAPACAAFSDARLDGHAVPATQRLRKRLRRQLVDRLSPWWRRALDRWRLAP